MRWGLIIFLSISLLFSRWTIPFNISNNYFSSFLIGNNGTNLLVDDQNNIHFIWYDYTPYLNYLQPQIFYKFYSPKTGFSENYCVSDNPDEMAYYPSFALDSLGNIHLVYVAYGNYYSLKYKVRSAATGRFTQSEILDSSQASFFSPSIAIFPDGRIGITYCKRVSSFYQIFYKEKNQNGWQAPIRLTSSNFNKYNPAIAVDQNKNLHIVWEGRENGLSYNQIFYIKRDSSNNWQERVLVSEGFSRAQYSPTIISDKENNIHIAWYGYHPEENIYYRIYYRFLDNEGNWHSIETIAGSNENYNRYRFYPFLTYDQNNRLYLIWFGQENSSYYKIWLKIKENNNWQEKIQIPDNYPLGSVYNPEIFAINSDYLHIIFYDYRTGNAEIFYTTTQPYDLGINKIIQPKRYNLKGIITPQIEVKNYFNTYHTFKAYCQIFDNHNQSIYLDSQFNSISGFDSTLVSFQPYNFQEEKDYKVSFLIALPDDTLKDNDTVSKIFTIGKADIGISEILAPKGVVPYEPNQTIKPIIKVKNLGELTVSFYLYSQIQKNNQTIYFDSVYISSISPNEERIAQFSPFLINDSGNFKFTSFIKLEGDVDSTNDLTKNQFYIINKGSQYWYLLRELPSLPSEKRVGKGSALAIAYDTLIFALKGNNTSDFYSYNINTGLWQILPPIPYLPSKNKNVKEGGSLVFDGKNYLYIIKGNNTKEFWRYHIFNKTFEILPEIPGEKNVKKGADLAFFNGKIYLLKGNNTKEFLVYDTATKFWSNLKQPPVKKGFKEGSSIVIGESIPAIYLLQGKTNLFFRYLIEKDSWESLPSLPLEHPITKKRKSAKGGGCLAIKDNLIYAIKGGGTKEFWCFNPFLNKWLSLETIPLGPYNKGIKEGTMIANSFGIFVLKGNNTNEFWLWIGLPNFDTIFNIKKSERLSIQQAGTSYLANKKGEIYDITGRKLKKVERLKKGIYFLKERKKFIIIKR